MSINILSVSCRNNHLSYVVLLFLSDPWTYFNSEHQSDLEKKKLTASTFCFEFMLKLTDPQLFSLVTSMSGSIREAECTQSSSGTAWRNCFGSRRKLVETQWSCSVCFVCPVYASSQGFSRFWRHVSNCSAAVLRLTHRGSVMWVRGFFTKALFLAPGGQRKPFCCFWGVNSTSKKTVFNE